MTASFPSLQFDEAMHTYSEGGIIRPSVTQCLKSENFINFDGIPAHILERKKRLGTLVHQATQLWDEGVSLEQFDIPLEVYDYLEGYVNFREDCDFSPQVIERRSIGDCCGMRFGMCPDRIGNINGELHVLELKCGASEHPAWGLQCAAYDMGNGNGKPIPTMKRVALQLGPKFKRGYKLHPYDDRSDYMVWLNCLANTIWKMNHTVYSPEPIEERIAA